MNCRNAQRAVLLENSTELPAGRRKALAKHLSACPQCRAFRDDLGQLSQFGRLHSSAVENAPSDRIVRQILTAGAEHPPYGWAILWRPVRPLLAVAAALLIVVGLWHTTFRPPAAPQNGDVRMARISEMSGLLATLMEPENEWTGETEALHPHAALRSFARQLLIFQEMSVDWPDERADGAMSPEEHLPTTLQWHSTRVTPAERCG